MRGGRGACFMLGALGLGSCEYTLACDARRHCGRLEFLGPLARAPLLSPSPFATAVCVSRLAITSTRPAVYSNLYLLQ